MTRQLLDILTEGRTLPDGFDSWGLKTVDHLRRTMNALTWPPVGGVARSSSNLVDGSHACPRHVGDGLTVALTPRAACSGGLPLHSILLVAFRNVDVHGHGSDMVRVAGDVIVVAEWLIGDVNLRGADLQDANLRGADLRGADLQGADLQDANLQGADLQGADLQGADLRGADLQGAYLRDAKLKDANLRYADLQCANLQGANLRYADLQGANLQGANLQGANLQGANLTYSTR